MTAIDHYELRDHLFDSIGDAMDRNYVGYGTDDRAIGQTFLAENRGRVKRIQMVGSDGTTTIDIKINGQQQFKSAQPSVEGTSYDNPSYYTYNRGDVVEIAVIAGTATGRVLLDIENHELIKQTDVRDATGHERFTRDLQKEQYLVKADAQHFTQERFGSLLAAAAGHDSRGHGVNTGGSQAPSGNHGTGGFQGTGSGGTQNLPGPNYPHPGGGTGGGHKPGGGGSHGGHR